MFRSLHHLSQLGITPKEVFQWCDNERAVCSSNNPPRKHVYGHQDTRGERKKSNTKVRRQRIQIEDERETALASDTSIDTSSTDSLPASPEEEGWDSPQAPINPYARPKHKRREIRNNIRCDEMASETTKIARELGVENLPTMPKTLEPPFRGSRAMLKIAGRWVTSDYKRHIYNAFRRPSTIEYMKGQCGWSDGDISSIDWATIGRVRTKMSVKWRRQTSKIMHGWLPTMHMRRYVTGLNQCPGCACRDETIDHMPPCPHSRMKSKREEVLEQLRKKGLKKQIPKRILYAVSEVMSKYFRGREDYIHPTYDQEIKTTIWRQEQLGMKYTASS
ncbi:hypothetical protein ACHAWF_015453 [Thalassiosira exigua]